MGEWRVLKFSYEEGKSTISFKLWYDSGYVNLGQFCPSWLRTHYDSPTSGYVLDTTKIYESTFKKYCVKQLNYLSFHRNNDILENHCKALYDTIDDIIECEDEISYKDLLANIDIFCLILSEIGYEKEKIKDIYPLVMYNAVKDSLDEIGAPLEYNNGYIYSFKRSPKYKKVCEIVNKIEESIS